MSDLYIVTLSEIKAVLGITDDQDDAQLTLLAQGLQGRFENFSRRLLKREENRVETHDPTATVFLRLFPVEDIASVKIGDETYDGSEISWTAERGYVHIIELYRVRNPIEITYTAGYHLPGEPGMFPMPEDLRRALLMQLRYEFKNKDTLGMTSMSAQGHSVNLSPADLLPEVKSILQPYRRY